MNKRQRLSLPIMAQLKDHIILCPLHWKKKARHNNTLPRSSLSSELTLKTTAFFELLAVK